MGDSQEGVELPLSQLLAAADQVAPSPAEDTPGMLPEGAELKAARLAYEREERTILERLAVLDARPDHPEAESPYQWDVY